MAVSDRTQYGISLRGPVPPREYRNIITGNTMSTVVPSNSVQFCGVMVGFENNIEISNNYINGLSTTADLTAIAVGNITDISGNVNDDGNEVTNATISRNRYGTVTSTSATGFSAVGISLASFASGTNTIVNNMVTGVTAPSTSGDLAAGIYLGGVTGTGTARVYHNSVSMSGTRAATTSYPVLCFGHHRHDAGC